MLQELTDFSHGPCQYRLFNAFEMPYQDVSNIFIQLFDEGNIHIVDLLVF